LYESITLHCLEMQGYGYVTLNQVPTVTSKPTVGPNIDGN